MPRACVTENYEDFEAGRDRDPLNSYLDYCRDCYGELSLGQLTTEWDVPDDAVEMDCEHPWYDESDYSCEHCGCALTDKDN